MTINNKNYFVDVIENTTEFIIFKVGITKEDCEKSNCLTLTKRAPFMSLCKYKTLAIFKYRIEEELSKNNYRNFGDCENPVETNKIFEHRFSTQAPFLPLTKLQ